ncbi:MAG: RHS repeat-associated core domain-containing protein [Dokdonella sp.]
MNLTSNVPVPILSCEAIGASCNNAPPLYGGPTPPEWGAAAQLQCQRFSAAHYMHGTCGCGGVCSSPVSCALVQPIVPIGSEGGNLATAHIKLDAINHNNGLLWSAYTSDYGDGIWSYPACTCPEQAGFDNNGACHCIDGLIWNGSICTTVCPVGMVRYNDTCVPPVLPSKNPSCPGGGGGGFGGGGGPPVVVGNPCAPGTGLKTQRETIYASTTLRLELTYISRAIGTALPDLPKPFGRNWISNYGSRVIKLSAGKVGISRPDGTILEFRPLAGGVYQSDADIADRVQDRAAGGWQYYVAANDRTELYDVNGRLEKQIEKSGREVLLSYSDVNTPGTIAPFAGLLIQVSDDAGRSLQWVYDGTGHVSSVTDPQGQTTVFSYGGPSEVVVNAAKVELMLTSLQMEGGFTKTFHYNEQANTSNTDHPEFLTGISENGIRFANFGYSAQGYATLTEHADGALHTQITYDQLNVQSTVTDPLGATRTFTFVTKQGVVHTSSVADLCPTCGIPSQWTYDDNGNVLSSVDHDGNKRCYRYDARNLQIKRVEGVSPGQACDVDAAILPTGARRLQTSWNPNFRVPTQRLVYAANGSLEAKSEWQYNSRGQVTAKCESDPAVSYSCGSAPNAPVGVRQWLTNYCESPEVGNNSTCPLLGLVKSVNGPRATTDGGMASLDDVATYTYYSSTDEAACATLGGVCHHKGDIWKVTNGLGQVTETVSYDKNGRVTRMKDVNGTVTDMTYHARGWLLTRTVRFLANGNPLMKGDATTTFAYDAVGNVTRVTQPDGAYLDYTYDDAHRLTSVHDNFSNSIDYCPGGAGNAECLDAAGNRRVELTKAMGGVVKRSLHREYNNLSRLVRSLNAANQTTRDSGSFNGNGLSDGYDGNGNAIESFDGNSVPVETRREVDPLNRLIKTIQDRNGPDFATQNTTTEYAYDARDNLRTVTDPSGLPTTYTYDGVNNLVTLNSPDTGQTGYTYDRAGNRITQTDNRGITSTYVYDALNRLTAITYVDTTQNVTFAYDLSNTVTGCASSYPLGRLTRMIDNSGSTTYCYDRRGNVLKKSQVTGGSTLDMVYTYDTADRLTSMTYPTGAIVTYGRDVVGRVTTVSWKANATTMPVTVISSASYYPFGPLNALTYGNGRTLTKTYDQDYAIDRVVSSAASGLLIDFTTDRMGNITDASDTLNPATKTRKYLYDRLYRLTAVDTGTDSPLEGYTYNATGDRTSKQLGMQTPQVYTYLAGTHRLGSVGGINRGYDNNGNTLNRGDGLQFAYDDRNRLSQVIAPKSVKSKSLIANIDGYTYNGKGERIARSNTLNLSINDRWVYGEAGQLLATYRGMGITGNEIVYLDSLPIAQVTDGVLSYLETDHLGTPRIAADPATNAQQWKWDFFADAFGDNAASPAASGGIDVRLRYPGQVSDGTGLNYNYFRDYEPGTGRYFESDPIGLRGGVNTYEYAGSDSLRRIDRAGLDSFSESFSEWVQCKFIERTTGASRGDLNCFHQHPPFPIPPPRPGSDECGCIFHAAKHHVEYVLVKHVVRYAAGEIIAPEFVWPLVIISDIADEISEAHTYVSYVECVKECHEKGCVTE